MKKATPMQINGIQYNSSEILHTVAVRSSPLWELTDP